MRDRRTGCRTLGRLRKSRLAVAVGVVVGGNRAAGRVRSGSVAADHTFSAAHRTLARAVGGGVGGRWWAWWFRRGCWRALGAPWRSRRLLHRLRGPRWAPAAPRFRWRFACLAGCLRPPIGPTTRHRRPSRLPDRRLRGSADRASALGAAGPGAGVSDRPVSPDRAPGGSWKQSSPLTIPDCRD